MCEQEGNIFSAETLPRSRQGVLSRLANVVDRPNIGGIGTCTREFSRTLYRHVTEERGTAVGNEKRARRYADGRKR